MVDSTIIAGPFGSERVPVPGLGDAGTLPVKGVLADGPRVPLTDATVQGEPGFAGARQAREARALEPDSNALAGMGAAINLWDTTRLAKRLARPNFDNDTLINANEYLQQVPMVLSEDEREYFIETAKGVQSAAYAMGQIEDRRMAQKVVGDHPIAGLAASFADPLWLVVPPAVRLGRTSGIAGRAVAGASGAALGGAVTALGEGPVSDSEIALSMLMNGAVATAVYREGKLMKADPDFPDARLNEITEAVASAVQPQPAVVGVPIKPRVRLVSPARFEDVQVPAQFREVPGSAVEGGKPRVELVSPATTERRKVADAVFEEIPPELQPGSIAPQAAQVAAVDTMISKQAKERGLGERLQWNIRKTMSSFGEPGRRVADLIFDNNSDLSITSMESHRESILSDLRTPQIVYEDLMRQAMSAEGAGLGSMINPLTSRRAYATQGMIEKEVQRELFRREQLTRQGVPVNSDGVKPHIAAMADSLDKLHKQALKEMQTAGVQGAENLLERPGYLNRKWSSLAIDDAIDRLMTRGMTREVAHSRIVDLVGLSLRRANGAMDRKLSGQVGQAIVDRALRKGYFEDSAFNAPSSVGQLAEIRDVLSSGGMAAADIERALNVMRVANDEAGKAAILKHRMDIDYRASMRIGDETLSVMDLIDGRVSTIVDQYVQQVATSSAFARKGLGSRSQIEALREELLHNLPVEQRKDAKDLFDNSLAHFRGEPAGAAVNEKFRLIQSYGRTISLAWSGLWQMTEYATAMAEYGAGKTLKYALQELPGFKQLMQSPTRAEAHSLNNVLAEHSVASLRLRPYIAKFEDGYDMDMGNAMQLAAQTSGQLVPYANAMRFVHHNQAKVVGNLILDRLELAANGNQKAREALARYGLESPVMDNVGKEIAKHGMNVDAWDDSVWAAARPAFGKMMDTAVLRQRLGDIPAFAAFDPLGKFLFTYRTFVLTAHNKVLAGMLERNGAASVGLVLMYQLPLAMAAVNAQSVIQGKGTLDADALVKKSIGQMGGLGLFSEPFKWATGESNSIGAPGLIPLDRGVKLFSGLAQGDPKQAASAALSMLPVLSANPFWNGMVKQIK